MSVIKKPAEGTRSVLALAEPLSSDGPVNFVCGGCRTVLIEGSHQGQFKGLVIQCPSCKAHNETFD